MQPDPTAPDGPQNLFEYILMLLLALEERLAPPMPSGYFARIRFVLSGQAAVAALTRQWCARLRAQLEPLAESLARSSAARASAARASCGPDGTYRTNAATPEPGSADAPEAMDAAMHAEESGEAGDGAANSSPRPSDTRAHSAAASAANARAVRVGARTAGASGAPEVLRAAPDGEDACAPIHPPTYARPRPGGRRSYAERLLVPEAGPWPARRTPRGQARGPDHPPRFGFFHTELRRPTHANFVTILHLYQTKNPSRRFSPQPAPPSTAYKFDLATRAQKHPPRA